MSDWTLFSNHGHVLVCLARDNKARLRSVADDVGITERAVQKIVGELQEAGFITISKHGRCNRYDINTRKALRHTLEDRCTVGRLLQLFSSSEKRAAKMTAEENAPVHETAAVPPHVPAVHTHKENPAPRQPAKQQSESLGMEKASAAAEKKTKAAKEPKEPADDRHQGSLF